MELKNYLTDIDGIKVGHAGSEEGATGVTVIFSEEAMTGGVDVRGSAPGTRETDLFKSEKTVDRVNAIVLSGGSAYGLAASSGVMKYLEEHDIGFDTPFGKVPIVSQAVIYDLNIGDRRVRPDAKMGYEACMNASVEEKSRGNIGAGSGACISKTLGFDKAIKSGLGAKTLFFGDLKVSALVCLNAFGDIYDGNKQVSGPYDRREGKMYKAMDALKLSNIGFSNTNTTIGVIATNADLTKSMANKLAQVGHNAYARKIFPVHTMSDGDTIFALSTNKVKNINFDLVLSLGVMAMEEAILDAVKSAESAFGYISISEIEAANRLNISL
ncbi:P1 family peptidase [Peptoniphilaceae bacterium SGI.131]